MPAFNTTDQSRDILRPGRIQLTIVCSLVLALSVSVFGAYRALTFTSAPAAVPTGGAIQTGDNGDSASGAESPDAADLVLTKTGPQFQTSPTPIEELHVGQRVRADAPTDDVDWQFGDEVVPSEWRKLTLTAPKRDGTVADVVLLRPRWWIEQQQAEVDGQVLISVPECGIDGDATVHSIGPCPEIVSGPGRVITGTFRHRVSSGIALLVEGEEQPIRCTGNHPFWSEDRQGFVRADSLKQRETLRITTGLAALVSSRSLPGDTFVYNIEVHGTHVYHVGRTGALVHNGDPEDCIQWVRKNMDRIDGEVVYVSPKDGAPYIGQLPGYDEITDYYTSRRPGDPQHAFILKDGLIYDAVHQGGTEAATWFAEFADKNGFKSVTEMIDFIGFDNLKPGFNG